ncbi:hypothetical protein AB7M49_005670 [Bradyrhizobium elkanii]|nr:hypothetical protein A6452_15565 [Bradyrhizobium elkanii]ODM86131.1 hypothetical protein A6X20_00270 [Bradyrhizobium elkanii]
MTACIHETSMDGTPSYIELEICLKMSVSAKAYRENRRVHAHVKGRRLGTATTEAPKPETVRLVKGGGNTAWLLSAVGQKHCPGRPGPMSGLPLTADLATPVQDGRIRYARERSPGIWPWTITVTIPGASFGSAATLDDAKTQFKAAWQGQAWAGEAGEGPTRK